MKENTIEIINVIEGHRDLEALPGLMGACAWISLWFHSE